MSGNVFGIRYQGISDHYNLDGNDLRFKRELSRLELDLSASIKRCERADDSCTELHDLHDFVCSKIDEV